MKKVMIFGVFFMLFLGCKSAHQNDTKTNEPIVSPTVISDDKAGNDEPQFPAYTPWWKVQ